MRQGTNKTMNKTMNKSTKQSMNKNLSAMVSKAITLVSIAFSFLGKVAQKENEKKGNFPLDRKLMSC